MRPYYSFLVLVFMFLLFLPCLAKAAVNQYTEDFTTTQYEDQLQTTAWWDTAAGELKLHPFELSIVGTCTTPSNAHKVAVDGNYAYVADDNSGLRVVDITDPVNPVLVGGVDTPIRMLSVIVEGDYVYATDYFPGGNNYMYIIDVSNPVSPAIVGTFAVPSRISGPVAVAGDYAYVPNRYNGLRVADISDPNNPVEVAAVATPGGDVAMAAAAGSYLYLAELPGSISVLDISDPLNPAGVASISVPGNAMLVTVEGNYLYAACAAGGLQVVDITDPTHPVLVGGDTTPECGYDVKIAGDYAYVSGRFSGLHVYDIQDPSNPAMLYTLDTINPNGLAVAGDYVYAADNNLRVIQFFQRRLNTSANKAQSLAVDNSDDSIIKARLSTVQVDLINWELSADGGSTWETVLPDNTWHTFASPGSDLLWRSTHVSIDASSNPICNSLSIEWESVKTVGLDVHPRSCPNPFNIQWLLNINNGNGNDNSKAKKGGIMPAAIAGSKSFDVTQIDLSTIRLEGVAPIRSSYEDVTRPVNSIEDCACSTEGPDGFMDLALKFSRQEIAAAIGPVEVEDVVELALVGSLTDGTLIEASDCVLIVGSREDLPSYASGDEVVLKPATPNPFNPATRISYYLPRNGFVKLSIFDVTGRLVQTLVAKQQPAGEYIKEWNALGQASGIYFYRIQVGDFVQTRKLILLK